MKFEIAILAKVEKSRNEFISRNFEIASNSEELNRTVRALCLGIVVPRGEFRMGVTQRITLY